MDKNQQFAEGSEPYAGKSGEKSAARCATELSAGIAEKRVAARAKNGKETDKHHLLVGKRVAAGGVGNN